MVSIAAIGLATAVIGGSAALAAGWHLTPGGPDRGSSPAVESEDPSVDSAARADAGAASARELAAIEPTRAENLIPRAGSAHLPAMLARVIPALDGAATEVLSGRVLIPVVDEVPPGAPSDGGVRHESAWYANGVDTVTIQWQDWPRAVDPSRIVSDDSRIIDRGSYRLVVTDHPTGIDSVSAVDGNLWVAVYTSGEVAGDVPGLTRLAEAVYLELRAVAD